jgi:trehalose 6-phosphate phosphatase
MRASQKGAFVTPITQPPAAVLPQRTAFFLDVDGTIAEIVQTPANARVSPASLAILERLFAASDGALALISGRDIAQLDRMLHPLRLPAVGVHGLEWRITEGPITRLAFDAQAHGDLVQQIRQFAATAPGLHCEPKPGSVALHFRNRPDLAEACQAFMQAQARADARLALLEGKMVVELIFGGQTKADAVARLMEEPAFAGRAPLFAGDDVTDEAAFRHVNMLGGITIKIGTGPSSARYRLSRPDALMDYLTGLLDASEEA